MKINKSKFYNFIFATVLLLQIFLPSFRTNIILQMVVLVFFFSMEEVKISKSFFKIILPIILLFLIGFLGFFIHRLSVFNALKDIFHFIKPILGLSIGYLFFKKINDFKLFVKTIVICGLISALIHFGVLFITGNIFSGSVNTIREFNKDSFLELFALFLALYYKKFQQQNVFNSKAKYKLIVFLLAFSCVLYFSRTMIVTAIILFFTIKGYAQISQKTIKIILSLLVFIALFYVFLFSIKIERNKQGLEMLLFKIKIAPSEILKTKVDRDNHKELWDHWRGYEAKRAFALMQDNPDSFLYGCGFGSLINLKFYAPLSNDPKGMKFISELHNGYPYILYKTGILGMILYLLFLYRLYIYAYKMATFNNVLISSMGLFFFFSTLTITGIYNANDVIVFILGAMLFFQNKTK